MFLANTRQYEKLNFTLEYEHFFHFGEVCRAILKKISQKKMMLVHRAELSFVSLSEFHAAR